MKESPKPLVTFYHRKPRAVGNYSIEFIFSDLRSRLAGQILSKTVYCRFESSGLFRRFYNCIEAVFKQGGVNHITGDVNYLGMFLSKRKTIQTIHDCGFLESSAGLKQKVLKFFWLTIPVKRAVYVTAISTATKNEILKYVNCDPNKIKVIPVAISDKYKRKEKPFNNAAPRILQIGTAPNKNIPRLIEALEGIPCILEIIGKHVPEYEAMLKQKNIPYEYHWGLSEEEMIHRYEEADIITLASTYEGFGMPILEAQAIGRPVITSNVFSMPEVAGEAAVLVNPFDVVSIRAGILKIIEDASWRCQLVNRGYENVKRYDADSIALRYLELYKKIGE